MPKLTFLRALLRALSPALLVLAVAACLPPALVTSAVPASAAVLMP